MAENVRKEERRAFGVFYKIPDAFYTNQMLFFQSSRVFDVIDATYRSLSTIEFLM